MSEYERSPVGSGRPAAKKKGESASEIAPRSKLIISPNLDALLEHEEKQRSLEQEQQPASPMSLLQLSPTMSTTIMSVPPNEEHPIGLPPPPRKTRNGRSGVLKSPLSPLDTRHNIYETPPGTPSSTRASPTSAIVQTNSRSNPYINPAPRFGEEEDGRVMDRDKSVTAATARFGALPASADLGRNFMETEPQESIKREKIGEHGFLKTLKKKSSKKENKNNDMQESHRPWRRRPLISHGQQSSVSSIESAETYSPVSSDHHRLSISSTVYPASSEQSHSQSIYNFPLPDMPPLRSSFIYSPPLLSQQSPIEPLSPINFATSPIDDDDHSPISPIKPPIPTTPKPVFSRPMLKQKSPTTPIQDLPPTTNFLHLGERSELVRKTRKLARVFGQTPGADAILAQQDANLSSTTSPYLAGKPRRRGVAGFHLQSPRRHSMPLSPDDVSFLSLVSPAFETPVSFPSLPPSSPADHKRTKMTATSKIKPSASPTSPSFIDLSDEERVPVPAPENTEDKSLLASPSQSILEIMNVNDPVEEERKRKRERLAKLHRYLGSRVPANLVLGIDDLEASLPPQLTPPYSSEGEETPRKWLRRRRSNSVILSPTRWSDDLERVKEDLDDKEKALNVRRAQKMEKVFGVAPPLTLYHTRHCPPSTHSSSSKSLPTTPPASSNPTSPLYSQTSPLTNLLAIRPSTNKPKLKKHTRPGTTESTKQLLPKGNNEDYMDEHHTMTATNPEDNPSTIDIRHSFVYNHYQHSLNSLNDILDRDDRESLAELHQYLNNMDISTPTAAAYPAETTITPTTDVLDFDPYGPTSNALVLPSNRRASIASTIKSERRRSLPARTSLISLASEYSVSSVIGTASNSAPKAKEDAQATMFQVRRRRAAKLTQFFGVNYRELVNDVLESIEIGVEHEQKRGTLKAEEVEALRSKLRNLKVKRQGLF